MGANSKIEWTDHTFNPWIGCSKVHEGCTHCYAESLSKRTGKALWGPNGTRVKTSDAYWQQPLKWNREAEQAGERRRVFCASLADVFEDWQGPVLHHKGGQLFRCALGCGQYLDGAAPTIQGKIGPYCTACEKHTFQATLDDLRRELFELTDATPWLDWLVLTKRPENARRMWPPWLGGTKADESFGCYGKLHGIEFLRRNVSLGTSVSNQATADAVREALLDCVDLCAGCFVSYEPALGPVDWTGWEFVRQIIGGGESGPGARISHPDWFRATRDFCVPRGIAFFFKQWGEWGSWEQLPADRRERLEAAGCTPLDGMIRVGKKAAGRLLDGREWNEFPQTEVTHA